MKTIDVTMVRIYLTESQRILDTLLKQLHDEEKVMGVTIFRGISGFGKSGKMHIVHESLKKALTREKNRTFPAHTTYLLPSIPFKVLI